MENDSGQDLAPAAGASARTRIPVADRAACGCGEEHDELPELDARQIPHSLRHASILGALASVQPGSAMVLVTPHDPLPLLKQISQREGDAVEVAYLQRGPEAWRLRLSRRG